MDSQYILLSELLSDQAAFITSPKTSLANYWGALPPCPPPVSTGLVAICRNKELYNSDIVNNNFRNLDPNGNICQTGWSQSFSTPFPLIINIALFRKATQRL